MPCNSESEVFHRFFSFCLKHTITVNASERECRPYERLTIDSE
jgi:hypothetical protein